MRKGRRVRVRVRVMVERRMGRVGVGVEKGMGADMVTAKMLLYVR